MKIEKERYYKMNDLDEVLKECKPSEIAKMICHPLFHRLHSYFIIRNNRLISYNTLEDVLRIDKKD